MCYSLTLFPVRFITKLPENLVEIKIRPTKQLQPFNEALTPSVVSLVEK